MRLVIITAIHQRYDLTYAFIKAMDRIRREFGIETYAVVSYNDECISLLKEFNIYHKEEENKPLGRKFNVAVEMLREVDFTHMMILGSDDIPSSRFIGYSLEQDPDNEYDFIGLDGLWFWGMNPRRAGFKRFGYFPVRGVLAGAGKMVSRRALEACDFAPWPDDCNYGMDAKMMKHMRNMLKESGVNPTLKKYSTLNGSGFLVDIKFQQHISSLSPIHRRNYYIEQDPHEVIPYHLPEDESNYLFLLMEKTESTWKEIKGR